MRLLLISADNELTAIVENFGESSGSSVIIYNDDSTPIKILSSFLSSQPSVIVIDDDFMAPNSVTLIESIRNVNQKAKIIFTTSDSSLELGKKISQLGIYFYNIKPIVESEFKELLDSIIKSKTQQSY
jgi:response regulator of citrate/malate metabolism